MTVGSNITFQRMCSGQQDITIGGRVYMKGVINDGILTNKTLTTY